MKFRSVVHRCAVNMKEVSGNTYLIIIHIILTCAFSNPFKIQVSTTIMEHWGTGQGGANLQGNLLHSTDHTAGLK